MVTFSFKVEKRAAVLVKNAEWLVFVEPSAELVESGVAEDEIWGVESCIPFHAKQVACSFQ